MTERTSIWLRPDRAARGPVPEHSRDSLAAAAVRIADESGIDAVSMRRLAAEIDSGVASLYRYLDNRDELLDLMCDAVAAEYDLSGPPPADWVGGVVDLARQSKAVFTRHPWMIELVQRRSPLGPRMIDVLEHALATMAASTAPPSVKLQTFATVNGLTAMYVRYELSSTESVSQATAGDLAYLAEVTAAGAHPHLAAALAGAPTAAPDAEELFERMIRGTVIALLA